MEITLSTKVLKPYVLIVENDRFCLFSCRFGSSFAFRLSITERRKANDEKRMLLLDKKEINQIKKLLYTIRRFL